MVGGLSLAGLAVIEAFIVSFFGADAPGLHNVGWAVFIAFILSVVVAPIVFFVSWGVLRLGQKKSIFWILFIVLLMAVVTLGTLSFLRV